MRRMGVKKILVALLWVLLTIDKSYAQNFCKDIFKSHYGTPVSAPVSTNSLAAPFPEVLIDRGNQKLVVWTRGPRAHQTFRALPKMNDALLSAQDFVHELKNKITTAVELIGLTRPEISEKYKGISYQPRSPEEFESVITYIFYQYFGVTGKSGFEIAQYYDLGYANLVSEINKNSGLHVWINKVAKEIGGSVEIYISAEDVQKIWLKLLKGQNRIYQEGHIGHTYYWGGHKDFFYDASDPILLTHTTYGSALSGILNARALQSATLIEKTYGRPQTGEMSETTSGSAEQSRRSLNPYTVAFWKVPDNRAISIGTLWSSGRALDYPIIFGVGASRANKINTDRFVTDGVMGGEIQIKDSVALSEVTHAFVPYFKVNEIFEILASHGYSHIKVLPLSFDQSMALFPNGVKNTSNYTPDKQSFIKNLKDWLKK